MALLPNIPTSFVPRTDTSPARSQSSSVDFGGVLSGIAYLMLVLMFVAALGLFVYGRILANQLSGKDATLAKARAAIDPATVHGFVQLRDRLNSSSQLLNGHVAPSRFFAVLGSVMPATVRFSSLHLTIDSANSISIDGAGVSKSFNALSIASQAFAEDGRIKNVIFSKMSINKDNSVSFGFTATMDPKIISYNPDDQPVGQPAPASAKTAPTSATSTPL